MEEHESGAPAPFEVFRTLPSQSVIDRVRAHVAATGMPETFPGLHRGPIEKDEPFYILGPISVPRSKRPDEKKAPCPRCRCPDKFYEGQLVWFSNLKAVAVVGHCCAAAEQSNEAKAEYRQREARRRAEEYLEKWLFKVPARLQIARELEPVVAECQRVFDKFQKDGKRFHQALRKASRGDAQLTITEIVATAGGPVGMRTSGSNTQTRDVQFGRLAGLSVVATKCTVAATLSASIAILERLSCYDTDDAWLEFMAPLTDDEKSATEALLKQAIDGLEAVEATVGDFRRFFSVANLDRISRWGSQHESPTPMTASIAPYRHDPTKRLFEIKGEGGRWFRVIIENALWGSAAAEAA